MLKQPEFEKDKIIIHLKRYVSPNDCRKIFKEELLNSSNNFYLFCSKGCVCSEKKKT